MRRLLIWDWNYFSDELRAGKAHLEAGCLYGHSIVTNKVDIICQMDKYEFISLILQHNAMDKARKQTVFWVFLAPLTRRSAQRSWWYYWFVRRPSSSSVVRRRPSSSVNFCFKSLLLLQFFFENSEFFTGETRHIVPPCNKAGISNFCLEFQKFQKFQISWKRYSSYSSYSIILKFLLEKLGI